MASFNMETPGITRNPEKNNASLRELIEVLRYTFQNIDEDNLGEDLYTRLANIESRLANIESRLDEIVEYFSEE